ncbi:MAG: hypothetical protein QM527_07585 [Alphaproteobacteria bacterium]|nr:hypothetical protein [Alphaproteobacteria bacterium]
MSLRPFDRQSLALGTALALMGVSVAAQVSVWRCGSTLTNRLPEGDVQRRDCIPITLPSATTLHAAPASLIAPRTGHSPQSGTRERTNLVPGSTVQISPVEQKQRDALARQLIEAELERTQALWRSARSQGDSAAAERAEADLASLQRELARLP